MYFIALGYKYIITDFLFSNVWSFSSLFLNTVDNDRGQIIHSEMFTNQ